jgi:hypothetical protein
MGDLDLPNRIVMAPLTRMRAQSHDHVPTALQAEYYAQRASAGLIIAEATAISPEGFGWADTPGLPHSLIETAKSPIRLNPDHSSTVFRVRLDKLEPQTTCYYTVDSMEATGKSDGAKSSVNHFTTP